VQYKNYTSNNILVSIFWCYSAIFCETIFLKATLAYDQFLAKKKFCNTDPPELLPVCQVPILDTLCRSSQSNNFNPGLLRSKVGALLADVPNGRLQVLGAQWAPRVTCHHF
jgi:hypothetical protein